MAHEGGFVVQSDATRRIRRGFAADAFILQLGEHLVAFGLEGVHAQIEWGGGGGAAAEGEDVFVAPALGTQLGDEPFGQFGGGVQLRGKLGFFGFQAA